ncbi:MAG: hypothetical protein EBU25_08435, partial [Burkholderiaceae bacterium]|nr:hypothetical protein [Burkholderiaceae bacterium]
MFHINTPTFGVWGFIGHTSKLKGFAIDGLDIGTFDSATGTLNKISNALEAINNQRASLGAAINQMAYAADNLTNVSS